VVIDNYRSSLNIKLATTLKAISKEKRRLLFTPHRQIIHSLPHIDNTDIKQQAVKEKKRDSTKLQWSTKRKKSSMDGTNRQDNGAPASIYYPLLIG